MKYTLVNRKQGTNAKDDTEFVTWMRRKDVQYWSCNKEFMEGYAHRKLTYENIYLRYDDEGKFVEDLKSNNLLKVDSKIKSIWNLIKNKSGLI